MDDELFDAITVGDAAKVKELAPRVNVNAEDGLPLFMAILNGYSEIQEILKQHGAYCTDLGIRPARPRPAA